MEQAMMVDLTTARARARDIVAAINREGTHHPALAKASQNVAASAVLLDTLPALSTNGVDRVYHRMKYILGIAATLQAETPSCAALRSRSRAWAAIRPTDRRLLRNPPWQGRLPHQLGPQPMST
jgi:hypothetical protein